MSQPALSGQQRGTERYHHFKSRGEIQREERERCKIKIQSEFQHSREQRL